MLFARCVSIRQEISGLLKSETACAKFPEEWPEFVHRQGEDFKVVVL